MKINKSRNAVARNAGAPVITKWCLHDERKSDDNSKARTNVSVHFWTLFYANDVMHDRDDKKIMQMIELRRKRTRCPCQISARCPMPIDLDLEI